MFIIDRFACKLWNIDSTLDNFNTYQECYMLEMTGISWGEFWPAAWL